MSENNQKNNKSCSSSWSDDGPKKLSEAKRHFNPPDKGIPDAATLRDQWSYAIRQYSKWYSHAWGTAIFAGTAFFALGWLIKGENPIPSFNNNNNNNPHTHKDDTHP